MILFCGNPAAVKRSIKTAAANARIFVLIFFVGVN
jgi:hypothetical protein